MTLLFVDGFEHYGEPLQKWIGGDSVDFGGIPLISGGPVVVSPSYGCGEMTSASPFITTWEYNIPESSRVVMGARFRFWGTISSYVSMMAVATNSVQVSVHLHRGTGLYGQAEGIEIYAGSGQFFSEQMVHVDHTFSTSDSFYVEVQFDIANSGGAVEVRFDGVTIATASGDTQAQTAITANVVGLSGHDYGFDDFYVANEGAGASTFLGPIAIRTVYPRGNGSAIALVPSVGVNADIAAGHYPQQYPGVRLAWGSRTLSGDGTDLYPYLSTNAGAILGVQVLAAGGDEGGTVTPLAKLAGTTASGPTQSVDHPSESWSALHAAGVTYRYGTALFELDPAGAAWTAMTVNAAEFGVTAAGITIYHCPVEIIMSADAAPNDYTPAEILPSIA